MFKYSILFSIVCVGLAGCGGGGSSSGGGGGGGGGGGTGITPPTWVAGQFLPEQNFKNFCATPRTGTDPFNNNAPFPDRAGTAMHEKMWLRSWSNNTYLWYRELPDPNPANFSVLAYFDQLKTTALTDSGALKDDFHFAQNTAQYRQETQGGVSSGYGIRWSFGRNTPPRLLTVAYVEPNSPAAQQGVVRGDQVITVNGVDFVNDNSNSGVTTLNNALFPSSTGQTNQFTFRPVSGADKSLSLTSANVSTSPVQNVTVLDTAQGKVGYMQFNTHIALAQPQLINAIQQFSTENVQELVIDLRYNGGGLLALASQFAYMVSGPNIIQSRFFDRTRFNDKHPNINPVTGNPLTPMPFYSVQIDYERGVTTGTTLPSLGLSRIYVLSTANTCSASEAFINGLRGIDVEVILIGGNTCGKPYGFYPTDNCGTTYFTIQFSGENAKGFGDYADGFRPTPAPVFQADVKGCVAADDFSKALGDPEERLLSTALYFMANNSCPMGMASQNVNWQQGEIAVDDQQPLWQLDVRYRSMLLENSIRQEIRDPD